MRDTTEALECTCQRCTAVYYCPPGLKGPFATSCPHCGAGLIINADGSQTDMDPSGSFRPLNQAERDAFCAMGDAQDPEGKSFLGRFLELLGF